MSTVGPTNDDNRVKRLVEATVYRAAPPECILTFHDNYVYATDGTVSLDMDTGAHYAGYASETYAQLVIAQLHQCISIQLRGYSEFFHDMQYFAGASLNYSTIIDPDLATKEDLLQRLNEINGLATLVAARGTYYRYINEDHDNLEVTEIDVVRKLSSLKLAATTTLASDYGKVVDIDIVADGAIRVLGVDLFDFVALSIIENAIKYGEPEHVSIKIRLLKDSKTANLRIEFASFGLEVHPSEWGALFEQGYRGAAAKDSNIPGDGMGLFQAYVGASRLFQGKLTFRQGMPRHSLGGLTYNYTVVAITIPKDRIVFVDQES